jgi:hypothetical protein
MSWLSAPAALHAVAGAGDPAVHRAALVEAVRRLTAP